MAEMAQKIIKLNKDELIKELNVAYAEEWLAYYQYWLGAQLMVGPMRSAISEEFMEHANEELKHAKWLAERIVQLGGTPVLDPSDLIEQNVVGERCAIARYQKICDMTFGKDYETFRISEKILKEEIKHEQEIGDFGEDIRAGIKYGDKLQ